MAPPEARRIFTPTRGRGVQRLLPGCWCVCMLGNPIQEAVLHKASHPELRFSEEAATLPPLNPHRGYRQDVAGSGRIRPLSSVKLVCRTLCLDGVYNSWGVPMQRPWLTAYASPLGRTKLRSDPTLYVPQGLGSLRIVTAPTLPVRGVLGLSRPEARSGASGQGGFMRGLCYNFNNLGFRT